MGKICNVVLIGWGIIFCTHTIIASPGETFIERALGARVFITTFDSSENECFASGVLAKDYRSDTCIFLITNKHVLENKVKVKVDMKVYVVSEQGEKSVTEAYVIRSLTNREGKSLWKTDDTDSSCDIAVLELYPPFYFYKNFTNKATHIVPTGLVTSDFASDEDIYEGMNVYYVGHPLGIRGDTLPRGIVRQGIIASKYGRELKKLFSPAPPQDVYILEAWGVKGSSGSPVFLSPTSEVIQTIGGRWKFIGVTSARKLQYYTLDTTALILPNTLKSTYNLPDTIFCRLKLPIPENTGLYFVVPARKIRKVLAKFDPTWK